jgi:flagellar biosynthetic protein FliR
MQPAWESLAGPGLACVRVAGLATFAPMLAGGALPVRMRLAVAAAIAVAAMPAAGAAGVPAAALGEPWRLLPAAVLEFALGAALGVVALLPVAAFRSAGALAGVQMGLGFGGVYDAEAGDAEGDAASRLLAAAGVALFAWCGGLDAVALAAMRTFDHAPAGAWSAAGAVPAATGAALAACELAFRVALPVTALLVAEALVGGFVARSVPGMSPLAFGFPVRVIVGLAGLLAGAVAMQSSMQGAVAGLLDRMRLAAGGAA